MSCSFLFFFLSFLVSLSLSFAWFCLIIALELVLLLLLLFFLLLRSFSAVVYCCCCVAFRFYNSLYIAALSKRIMYTYNECVRRAREIYIEQRAHLYIHVLNTYTLSLHTTSVHGVNCFCWIVVCYSRETKIMQRSISIFFYKEKKRKKEKLETKKKHLFTISLHAHWKKMKRKRTHHTKIKEKWKRRRQNAHMICVLFLLVNCTNIVSWNCSVCSFFSLCSAAIWFVWLLIFFVAVSFETYAAAVTEKIQYTRQKCALCVYRARIEFMICRRRARKK